MFNLRRFCIGAALGLSLLACRPALAQTNLLKDPHFNKASLSVWTGGGLYFKSGTGGRGGSGGYLSANTGQVSQKITLPKNVTYFITGYYKGTAKDLGFSLSGTSSGASNSLHSVFASNYTRFSVSIKPTYKVHTFILKVDNAGTTRKLQLDDLGLYNSKPVLAPEVDPEAGAPALALALGGLALMSERRRRRETSTESLQ